MRKISSVVIIVICVMFSVSGQTRTERRHLETSASPAPAVAATEAANEAFYPRTSYSYPVEDFRPGVVRVGPRTTYLKEGLRTDEVVRLLGQPVSISERNADGLVVTIYAFQRGERRILIAEFLSGVLVRSWIETLDEQVVKADR